MNAVLQLQDLAKSYQGSKGVVRAVDGVSLEVGAGEFVAVQGPSGCGKTTLLLAAGGLLQPTSGQVRVDGQDPYALSPGPRAQFRGQRIGFVFQQFHLIPFLSVLDNILTPTLAFRAPGAAERARELIAQFGLQGRAQHVAAELSTGERQRTALARALLNRPKLLLADEPTGNLDNDNGAIVLKYLAEFAKSGGAVLLVTHDAAAVQSAHRAVRLKEGKLTQG